MRAAAILGVIIFTLFAWLGFKLARYSYKKQKVGELQTHPPIVAGLASLLFIILTILCFIYAIGLWDAFVAWGHFGQPKPRY